MKWPAHLTVLYMFKIFKMFACFERIFGPDSNIVKSCKKETTFLSGPFFLYNEPLSYLLSSHVSVSYLWDSTE